MGRVDSLALVFDLDCIHAGTEDRRGTDVALS